MSFGSSGQPRSKDWKQRTQKKHNPKKKSVVVKDRCTLTNSVVCILSPRNDFIKLEGWHSKSCGCLCRSLRTLTVITEHTANYTVDPPIFQVLY